MKKLFLVALIALTLCGCGKNQMVTKFGGTKDIDIPEGYKFINYNIQEDNMIWCTYRPMREDEFAEVYIVKQDKTGMHVAGDGKFVIYETKDGIRAELPEETEQTTKENLEKNK